jgi:hypothetical protein
VSALPGIRIQEYIVSFLNDKEDDSVPFVGCGWLWGCGSHIAFLRFLLQILFQEMKNGHL